MTYTARTQQTPPQAILKERALATVTDLLMKSQERIAAVLPKHLTPEKMIRVALTTIQSNPRLLLCTPLSVIGTIVQASELGLELNGFLGEAYMVPYYNNKTKQLECQFQAGYRGLISLARRSGLVDTIKPVLVFHGDHFEIEEGTDAKIIHKPDIDNPTRGLVDHEGNMIGLRGCYAVVRYLTGAIDFEYLPLTRLDELRDMSKAVDSQGQESGPWVTHPGEMYRKVPIRQLAKRLPLSPEFQKAGVLDEYGDTGVRQNLATIIEGDRAGYADVLGAVADARAQEMADKYATQRQQAPAQPQPAPRPTQQPQQAAPPPDATIPIEAYDAPPAPPRQAHRPSNANVGYGEHFASAPRNRRRGRA